MSFEITFSTSEDISGSLKVFTFSVKRGFIVRCVTYFKTVEIGLFFFSYQTNTIITLLVIGYSVNVGFGVYKFISLCILLFMNEA